VQRALALALVSGLALAACAGGDDGSDDPTAAEESSGGSDAGDVADDGESSESSTAEDPLAYAYRGCVPELQADELPNLTAFFDGDSLRIDFVVEIHTKAPGSWGTSDFYGALSSTLALDAIGEDGAFSTTLVETPVDPDHAEPVRVAMVGMIDRDGASGTYDFCDLLEDTTPCSGAWSLVPEPGTTCP